MILLAKRPQVLNSLIRRGMTVLCPIIRVVMCCFIFYPKDMTPGCTTEACTFRDYMNKLRGLDIQVLGVSCDTVEKHEKFADKYRLNFPLLADVNKKVVQDYGVWGEKNFLGKKYMGINRESFLIDPKGKVIKHYEKVKPDEHPKEVLEDVKAIS